MILKQTSVIYLYIYLSQCRRGVRVLSG